MKSILMTLTLLVLMLLSGCVFSDAKLDVAYNESLATAGPLSAIDPVRIQIKSFQDERPFVDRIGEKRNAYGMDCADVVTTSPVPDVIRGGLVAVLQKNGHIITDEGADVIVTGVIKTFWFEIQMGFWTAEFMGTADVTLEFHDALSNTALLSRTYSGHHNEEYYSGYHKEMQFVMNQTLKDLVNSIAMDPPLSEVLGTYSRREVGSR
jgi:uncharacterized lipoprotein YajG